MSEPSSRRTPASRLRAAALPAWAGVFLAELAVTSNVSAAARAARISSTTAYDWRRANAEFNRKWQQALCEGYDHLELELLHRLRTGEVKPAPAARRGVRSFENATGLRLLAAHRESAARLRAMRDEQDSEAIIVAINAKLDRMRERHFGAGGAIVRKDVDDPE